MSAHNVTQEIFQAEAIADPGASGTINIDRSPAYVGLSSLASETRTLNTPTLAGAIATLVMKVDGGDITLTVTGGYNEDGDTTFTFSDPGQFIVFESVESAAGTFVWRKLSDYVTSNVNVTELGYLSGVTAGTGAASKALVLDSSGNVVMPDGGFLATSREALAAAGTNAATAAVIGDQVCAVTAADNTKGVALPAAATTTGPIWVINTDVDARLFVYPVSGGNDNINGLAEDAAYEVGPGEACMFIPTSATQWYTGVVHNLFNAEVVTAANTITAAENGKTFFLNSGTEFASTLPAPAAGLRFNFIVTAAPSGADYTIVTSGSSNIMLGQVYTLDVNSATDPDFEATGGDTVSFVSAKSIVGDRCELFCDGTNWFAYCFCSVFDAITISTAS